MGIIYINERDRNQQGLPWDPTGLIALARVQWALRPQAVEALAACTLAWPDGPDFDYLFPPEDCERFRGFVAELPLRTPTRGMLRFMVLCDLARPEHWVMGGVEYVGGVTLNAKG